MAIFGVIVEDKEKPKQFFKEVKERLGTTNLARNPFTGGIFSFISLRDNKGETIVDQGYIIKMAPLYVNYPLGGFCFMVIGFILWPRIPIAIAAAVFLLLSLGWSSRFYYFILKMGLKKKGYKGLLKYLKPKDIIEEVYFKNGSERRTSGTTGVREG